MFGWLGRLADPTLASAAQVIDSAASNYERIDQSSGEMLNRIAPAGRPERTGAIQVPGTPNAFNDIREPQIRLTEIPDYTAELNGDYDWWDSFSPMNAIGAAIEDVAVNIESASLGVPAVWQSDAGRGVAAYLVSLAKPLHEAMTQIHLLRDQYRMVSDEMVRLREAVVNILKSIGDDAIAAAVSLTVAGGSVATGVGLPVGVAAGAFSAYRIYRVINGIKQIFDVIGQADGIVKYAKALQTIFGGLDNTGTISLPPLPGPLGALR